jgi:hypothetical protein
MLRSPLAYVAGGKVAEDFWKADALQLIGVAAVGLAVPILFPALRPQFAALLKAGVKLALEAEFDADEALADALVSTAVNALLRVSPQDSEKDLCRKSEATVDRFLAAAHSSAARRGWDQQDVAHRYHRRLAKLDHAISRAHHQARAPQRAALEHASKLLQNHHVVADSRPVDVARGSRDHSAAKHDRTNSRSKRAGNTRLKAP